MGKDYLVEGARLMCIQGGIQTSLCVPMGHGCTSDGKKKANCGDCLAITMNSVLICKRGGLIIPVKPTA